MLLFEDISNLITDEFEDPFPEWEHKFIKGTVPKKERVKNLAFKTLLILYDVILRQVIGETSFTAMKPDLQILPQITCRI